MLHSISEETIIDIKHKLIAVVSNAVYSTIDNITVSGHVEQSTNQIHPAYLSHCNKYNLLISVRVAVSVHSILLFYYINNSL